MVMCCIFKLALMLLAFHGCQSHLRILSSPFVQASFCILDALRPTSTFTELRGLSEFFLLEYFLLFAPKIYVPACRTLQTSERGREQLGDAYVLDKQLFQSVRCFSYRRQGEPRHCGFTVVGQSTHQLWSSAKAALIFFTELSTSSLIMTRYLVRETVQRWRSFTDFSIFGPKINARKKKDVNMAILSFTYELNKTKQATHPKQTWLLFSSGETLLRGDGPF